jgi:hypothetical protein
MKAKLCETCRPAAGRPRGSPVADAAPVAITRPSRRSSGGISLPCTVKAATGATHGLRPVQPELAQISAQLVWTIGGVEALAEVVGERICRR